MLVVLISKNLGEPLGQLLPNGEYCVNPHPESISGGLVILTKPPYEWVKGCKSDTVDILLALESWDDFTSWMLGVADYVVHVPDVDSGEEMYRKNDICIDLETFLTIWRESGFVAKLK